MSAGDNLPLPYDQRFDSERQDSSGCAAALVASWANRR